MDTTDNASVACALITAMNQGDWDAWDAATHPDLRYTILGIDLPGAGTMDKVTALAVLPEVISRFWAPGSPQLTVEHLHAAGDWVVIEAVGGGSMADGSPYENHYAMFFEVKDGRVLTLREYMDTQHLALEFARLAPTAEEA
jgi:ketosteroid isomerase-like protein